MVVLVPVGDLADDHRAVVLRERERGADALAAGVERLGPEAADARARRVARARVEVGALGRVARVPLDLRREGERALPAAEDAEGPQAPAHGRGAARRRAPAALDLAPPAVREAEQAQGRRLADLAVPVELDDVAQRLPRRRRAAEEGGAQHDLVAQAPGGPARAGGEAQQRGRPEVLGGDEDGVAVHRGGCGGVLVRSRKGRLEGCPRALDRRWRPRRGCLVTPATTPQTAGDAGVEGCSDGLLSQRRASEQGNPRCTFTAPVAGAALELELPEVVVLAFDHHARRCPRRPSRDFRLARCSGDYSPSRPRWPRPRRSRPSRSRRRPLPSRPPPRRSAPPC